MRSPLRGRRTRQGSTLLFLENWFWLFAVIAVPGYWLCPRRLKGFWLLGASLVFHWYFAGPAGMAPIFVLALFTYGAGLRLQHTGGSHLGWACLLVTSALVFYKYSGLGAETLAEALSLAGGGDLAERAARWHPPTAPLAISFFTFEFVHYLYEVGRGGRAPIRNPLHFAIFAIFFPTLAAGPIKRFHDFVPQLVAPANPRRAQVVEGCKRVIRGLFKKVCIADILVEYIVVLEGQEHFNAALLALLAVLQGFRIYYDFAGYSDMAIGLAQLLGLRVPENFDRPYFSTSLQDFWRRWHMSLSSWIRDYVYIPLGGNRARRVFNLIVAMAACGLWHGASWHFALWGIYHGVGLALEGLVRRTAPALFGESPLLAVLRWAVCYAFVSFGWLLFFYPVARVAEMSREALSW